MHFSTILYILLLLNLTALRAQNKETISGLILNTKKEPIENVSVFYDRNEGTVSNTDGSFSLTTSKKNVRLTISHTQYQPLAIYLTLLQDTNVTIILQKSVIEMEEVKIEANQGNFIKNKIPGMSSLNNSEIKAQASLLGIPDAITSLQRGTGVQSVSEGIAGIYVRGGDAGQNLIIYDHIELVDPSHLMGTYSVFNPYLIESVDLYKGNAPIEYTGRLSSSIVVNSYEKAFTIPQITVNIGTLASSIALAFQKEKYGFVMGGRRTQLELYKQAALQIAPETKGFLNQNHYSFYDHNGKVYYHSGDKDRLSLSWYIGGDKLNYHYKSTLNIGIAWQNKGAALNWKHTSKGWSSNTTLGVTNYSFDFDADILNYLAKFITSYYSNYFKNSSKYAIGNHLISFNTKAYIYTTKPQSGKVNNSVSNYQSEDKYKNTELILNLADSWQINTHLSAYYSLGLSNYWQLGPQRYLSIEGQDSSFFDYKKNERIKHYPRFSPQVFLTWERPNNLSFKGTYSFNNQNIHRGSLASLPLPADIWMPSTQILKPETAHQVSMGAYKSKNDYDFSAEIYGRKMDNILLFEANLTGTMKANFEENFKAGEGYSIGLELLARKNAGPYTGWIAYTLSKSKKKIPLIANNQWFDSKYDRIHDLSIVANYAPNKQWDFSLGFILASGNKSTVPAGRYLMMGYIMNDYTDINNFRMPIYHRLDLSVNYHLKPERFKESTFNFSIINALNRQNTYFFFYEVRGNMDENQITVNPKQFSLFPILPSISWTFTL